LIDQALAGGWEHRRACSYLELDEGRAWRWRRRRDGGCLDDGKPGSAVHGLRPEEIPAVLPRIRRFSQLGTEFVDPLRNYSRPQNIRPAVSRA
jgi:hypothetical protein